jgi:hypothetical protein
LAHPTPDWRTSHVLACIVHTRNPTLSGSQDWSAMYVPNNNRIDEVAATTTKVSPLASPSLSWHFVLLVVQIRI